MFESDELLGNSSLIGGADVVLFAHQKTLVVCLRVINGWLTVRSRAVWTLLSSLAGRHLWGVFEID